MSDVMISQIILALATLSAAGLGGYIGLRIANSQARHQAKIAAERRLIEKMEKLHEVLTKLSHQAQLMQMMIVGKVGFSADIKPDTLSDEVSTGPMNMLVDFYLPSLRDEADEIEKGLQRLAATIARAILEKPQTDKIKGDLAAETIHATLQVDRAVKTAKRKLSLLAAPYTRPQPSRAMTAHIKDRLSHWGVAKW